jgi:hypothetical protein
VRLDNLLIASNIDDGDDFATQQMPNRRGSADPSLPGVNVVFRHDNLDGEPLRQRRPDRIGTCSLLVPVAPPVRKFISASSSITRQCPIVVTT